MSLAPKRRARRAALGLLPGLLALLLLAAPAASTRQAPPAPASVFELELPELGVAPTAQPEVVIPTPNVDTIVLNVLRPQSDQIDYGQIGTQVNGQSTGLLTEINSGPRGKIVRINLRRYPGYGLVAGRNTVEIVARNQRGREFYTSFVLRTATENRNQDFAYSVAPAPGSKRQVPPELVLLEPEREIVVPAGGRAQRVRFVGVATAAGSVARVTIDGEAVLLKRGAQAGLRGMRLANDENRVSFDAVHAVGPDAAEVVVEASDAAGARTQLRVPVRRGERPPPNVFSGKKYALVVGVSKFAHAGGAYDLMYADADALAVSKFLQTPAGGRFPADNILLLTNEQATLASLQRAMKSFITQPGPDDLLLIFLATHGVPDPSAEQNYYLLAHDTSVRSMADTGFAMKDFKRMLENNVRARRMILLVDTCHSAGLIAPPGVSTRGLRLNLISQYAEKMLYVQEGNAIITSSDVGEESREGPDWGGGHGVFTHFLLQGMGGMADSDSDRVVTVGELFRYVSQQVRVATEHNQHPRMQAGTNEDLALAAVAPNGRR
ncbi:MAG TPA: caspase family protein [Pyrinomonadaceae bacterium]|jgi:hypothetical protein